MGGKASVMQLVEERNSLKIQVLDLLEELAQVKNERKIIQRQYDIFNVNQMNDIAQRRQGSLEYYRREYDLKQNSIEPSTCESSGSLEEGEYDLKQKSLEHPKCKSSDSLEDLLEEGEYDCLD